MNFQSQEYESHTSYRVEFIHKHINPKNLKDMNSIMVRTQQSLDFVPKLYEIGPQAMQWSEKVSIRQMVVYMHICVYI